MKRLINAFRASAFPAFAFVVVAVEAADPEPIIFPDMKVKISVNAETLLGPEVNDRVTQYTERMGKICRAYGNTYHPQYEFSFGAGMVDPESQAAVAERLLARFPPDQVRIVRMSLALDTGRRHGDTAFQGKQRVPSVGAEITGTCKIRIGG